MLRSAIFLTQEQGCPVRSNCFSSPFRESIGVDDVAVYGPEQRQICRVAVVPMEGERVGTAANGSLIPCRAAVGTARRSRLYRRRRSLLGGCGGDLRRRRRC